MSRRFAACLGVLAVLAAACGGGAKTGPKAGGITYEKGPESLVLRIEFKGGFVPPTAKLTEFPQVSLFGDGRYVTMGPQIDIFPGPALPNLLSRKVEEAGMTAILAAAKEAGLLAGNRRLEDQTVADAPTTVFTVKADGKTHVVEAVALSEGVGGGQDPAFRKTLSEFRDLMTDLPRWLPKGSVSEETAYTATAVRLLVEPYSKDVEGGRQQPANWPAGALSAFGNARQEQPGLRCGVVRGTEAAKALAAGRTANQLTPWRSGGKEYKVTFRPLLPDEAGC